MSTDGKDNHAMGRSRSDQSPGEGTYVRLNHNRIRAGSYLVSMNSPDKEGTMKPQSLLCQALPDVVKQIKAAGRPLVLSFRNYKQQQIHARRHVLAKLIRYL